MVYHRIYEMTRCHEQTEDLAHDVFVKLARSHAVFTHNGEVKAWLYRTATTTAIDEHRHETSVTMCELVPQEANRYLPESEDYTIRCELREQIQAVRAYLTPRELSWFLLLSQGYYLSDIARMEGMDHSAVKMRIIRARRRIMSPKNKVQRFQQGAKVNWMKRARNYCKDFPATVVREAGKHVLIDVQTETGTQRKLVHAHTIMEVAI
jgi:RNA polymerase sigma factor (sigma-70 family)